MRIYSKALPRSYSRFGVEYAVRADFRTWAKYEGLISDTDLAPDMVHYAAMELIFPGKKPPSDSRLREFISWFYRCGEEKRELPRSSFRSYSLEYDEGYIYAAFLQQYGIDLCRSDMHWWQFSALLRGLRETKFNDIAGWRSAEIDKDTPRHRREFLEEMQEIYALPETLTDKERRERVQAFYKG